MLSQVLLAQLCNEVWTVPVVLAGAVTVRVWAVGAAPPATAVNINAAGLNVRPAEVPPATFRVTGTLRVPEAALNRMVPVQAAPAAIPDGSTETVKLVFVGLAVKVPLGERVSQLLFPQLCFSACAVTLVLNCAVTVSVCEAGAAPPATALNVKADGFKVKTDDGTVTRLRVTGTVCVADPALIVIVPIQMFPATIPD